MHASRSFPVAPLCRLSPDGRYVASLNASTVTITCTTTLAVLNTVILPSSLSKPLSSLSWSPSSTLLLVAGPDHIHAFSALDASVKATIENPSLEPGKSALICFGARDDEIITCSALGLKLSIYSLSSSTAVEIANPKFHQAGLASRSVALRPRTGHLVALTRSSGKDMLSIHDPQSRQIVRSWAADTVDAQGINWTTDGGWLLLWESPTHGHRLCVYTPDGDLFRTLDAESLSLSDLSPGIRLCQSSPDSALAALGDHSRTATIVTAGTWRRSLSLEHPSTIVPKDTLQVWQEQLGASPDGSSTCTFLRATQAISPPGLASDNSKVSSTTELKIGCLAALFDSSSTLLATKLEEAPCTLWVWDVVAGDLRAALVFHSPISFSWHPSHRETLLISCQDESRPGVFYHWDPLSQGPIPVLAEDYLPRKKGLLGTNKAHASWLDLQGEEEPVLFMENGVIGRFLSLLADNQETRLWKNVETEQTSMGSIGFNIS